ncbi:unnamed protein product [Rangifer tarandus platyrhynchus]|uniref:Uncharacterized protein n=1 Tax=Rangifer tarandus platyrhynchus TaxID=3082113 RepID=A0AC60A221_RANTA
MEFRCHQPGDQAALWRLPGWLFSESALPPSGQRWHFPRAAELALGKGMSVVEYCGNGDGKQRLTLSEESSPRETQNKPCNMMRTGFQIWKTRIWSWRKACL